MKDPAAPLTEAERDKSFPKVRPKDASTLILIDRTGSAPQVLLGRRHHGHRFMPGKFVFPGGRVEATDQLMPAGNPLDPQMEQRLMRRVQRPSTRKARAFALAAIRETFEETGLLLGAKANGLPPVPDGPWSAFAEAGILPDLAAIHFVARAITPPGRPLRFDTRFFAADVGSIGHRIDGVVGADSELVELVWVPLSQAGQLDLPRITRIVLDELESQIGAGFGHHEPVPFYRMLSKSFRRETL